MKSFLKKLACVAGVFGLAFLSNPIQSNAQSTLATGDLLFTSFSTNAAAGTPDTFSVVLLIPISSNTTIYFSDRGWNGSAWQGSGGTEGTIGWTSGTALPIGTEIQFAGLGGSAATVNGVPNGNVVQILGGNAVSGLSIGNGGDQLQAFQGGAGDPTSGSVTRIAGIHFSNCSGTSDAAWDPVACATGPSASAIFPTLVGGTSAFWAGAFQTQGKFVCNGTPFATVAALRAAVMNRTNWVFDNNQFSSTINVPPGCFYYSTCPPVTVTPTGQTNVTCNGGANGTATVSASGGSGFTYNWTPGNPTGDGTASVTGLTSQVYTCTVTNSCGATGSATLNITQPSAITISPTQSNVSCNGGSNGVAVATVSGGTGSSYMYSWAPSGGTGSIATGLTAQVYTVTVTDGASCTKTQTYNITAPSAIGFTTQSSTNVSCNGGSNGAASVNAATGGAGGFTYDWTPGNPTGDGTTSVTGLTAQVYTVTVTDANSCTRSLTFNITAPSAIGFTTLSSTNVSCNGGSNGAASVNAATGGAGGFTYDWTPGNPTGDGTTSVTGLTAQVYTVTTTDANNCTRSLTFNITAPAAIGFTTLSSTNVSCNGGSNGAASVNAATGGAGGFTYDWTPGNPTGDGTTSVTGLTAQVYTVTTTDANSCTRSLTFNITAPAAIGFTTLSSTNVSCNGGSNGAASVNAATGGAGSFTYDWTPGNPTGDGTTSVTGLTAQVYTVTTTDANSCTRSLTFNITAPAAIGFTTLSSTNVSCNGGSNGAASVNAATGGAGSFTYDWTPGNPTGDGTTSVTGLTAQVYTVTATDANSCTRSLTVSITQPAMLNLTAASQSNISCNGGSNGTASVNAATGGAGGYTYNWTPGNPTGDGTTSVTGLSAQTYTCTVTDMNGCTRSVTFNITSPTPLAIVPSSSNVSCFGGSNGTATANVSGGAGGYMYSWSPSGGTNAMATGLASNIYTVTVTDVNSCTISQTYNITQPPVLNLVTNGTNTSCGQSDGTASVSVTGGAGGYTYNWTPGNPPGDGTANITGLAANTYTVTVTDANSCTSSATRTVSGNNAVTLSTTKTDITCFGNNNGSIDLTVLTGQLPYSFSWSNGPVTEDISGLGPNTYTVTVTDGNSCSTTASVTITEPALFSLSATITDVSCNGLSNGSIDITPSGGTPGYTYLWSNSQTSQDISGLVAGNYTVTATDAHTCTSSFTGTVDEPDPIAIIVSSSNITCNGINDGEVDITVSGGTPVYSYSWSNGPVTEDISGLAAGSYTVTITDDNGCTAVASTTITEPSALSVSTTVENVNCNGNADGEILLTVNGGTLNYSFAWSNSESTQDITDLAAGNYSVVVTDANGCTISTSTTVTEPSLLVVTPGTVTNVTCFGGNDGSASVSVSGGSPGYEYQWSPSGGNMAAANNLTAGTYTVTVTDTNLCTQTFTFTITEPAPTFMVVANATPDSVCEGGSVDLSATGADTYIWEPGTLPGPNVTTTPVATTTYTVTGTNGSGCTASATVVITVNPLPSVGFNANPGNSICDGSQVTLSGTGATSYSWTGGISNGVGFVPNSSGSYMVTGTDVHGCTNTAIASITVNPLPVINLGADIVQPNPPAIINAGAGFNEYLWSTMEATQSISVNTNGTYAVTVTDANGCTASDQIQVNFTSGIFNPNGTISEIKLYPNPSVQFITLDILNLETNKLSVQVLDLSGKVVQSWNAGSVNGTFNQTYNVEALSAGTYILTIQANEHTHQLRFIKK